MPETAIGSLVATKTFSYILSVLTKSLLTNATKQIHEALTVEGSSLHLHIKATFDRCTKIKTLMNRDEPVELLSLYVNLKFRSSQKYFDDFDLIEKLDDLKRIVISGTGGGGKTIFMKYLWISLFENPKGRVPIFVELRRLNEVSNDRLDLYIYHSIVDTQSTISQKEFESGIKAGRFIFILDGFDEIEEKKREILEQQILALAHNNPELIIVVSSRADPRFASWQAFAIFHVQPFSKAQTISLISKLHYDRTIRKKFSDRVRKDLYDKHQSFLSNPLLTTMMLLTFDQFADIPEKIHLFYDQAFDTLFAKHDATKEAYKRRMYTELSIDVFKSIFSSFCLSTYYDEKFSVSDTECLSYLKKSLKIDESSLDPNLFLKDLTESVCMLQRDGMDLVFVHRSFQEYFSAYFLARVSSANLDLVVKKIARRPTDNVIKMLHDMDQDFFEREFVLPNLEPIVAEVSSFSDATFVDDYCRFFQADIFVRTLNKHMRLSHDRHSDAARFVDAITKIYPLDMETSEAQYSQFQKIDSRLLRRNFKERVDDESDIRLDIGMEKERERWRLRTPGPTQVSGASWFGETGYAQWCRKEADGLKTLLQVIQRRQAIRHKAIDELLGIKH